MNIRLLFTWLFLLFISNQVNAQWSGRNRPAGNSPSVNVTGIAMERSSGTSGTGDNIDVIYHKIIWRINPDSTKYIRGSVQTNFKTTQANVSTISFDLNTVLIIDSVYFRFAKLPTGNITRVGNIFTVDLGATLPNNFIDSLTVYYQGIPPPVNVDAQGYQVNTSRASGNVINTLSESYEDRDWWPCKHDMQDKIDSMDIIVSVPWCRTGYVGTIQSKDTFWVASNGKMIDSSMVNDSTRKFVFQLRHPIPSYLVAVTVARFDRFYRTVNISGTAVPVVYNICKGAGYTATAVAAMDNVNLALVEFSKRFGDYPFKDVKHGFSDGLDGAGGMEHETMSSIASGSTTSVGTLVHEMTHQWFGDNVTFAHWNDLWLAEGFARYSEALYKELIPALGTPVGAYNARVSMKSNAIGYSTTSAYIPNSSSTTSNLIWNSNYGGTVYERGGMIVSMLRAMCGDSIFFGTLTKYQTELAGKSATTDTLRNYFNRALGRDISGFFDDYVGGSDTISTRLNSKGSPINTVSWNAIGSPATRLVVSVASQAKTSGSNVTYFRGPIQLHVKGTLLPNDTTITIFDWGGGNLSYAGNGISLPISGNRLTFDLSFIPTSVAYDDSARTMSTGTINNVPTLSNYVWQGTTNTTWGTATNWLPSTGLPPSGADITIATTGANQPVLPANTTVGPLTINSGKTLTLNGFTLTLNNAVRGTGTITGSATSNIIVADQAGTLNFTQTNLATHSLNTITLNPKASATIGIGLLDIFGGLTLPPTTTMIVKSANMQLH